MATRAQGFLGGLTSGMQTTMGLLDSLEAKHRREVAAKQQALLFQQQQDDRGYDIQNLRPLRLENAELGIKDKRSLVGYNQQARPLALQSSQVGLQGQRDTLKYNQQMRPLLVDAATDAQTYRKEDRGFLTNYQRPRQQMLDERGDKAYSEDRGYLTGYQRPRQQMLDERGDKAYSEDRARNKVLQNRTDEDYSFNKGVKEYEFQSVKDDRAVAWSQRYKAQQQERNDNAARAYQAAQLAAQNGDDEMVAFYLDEAEREAMPVTSALNGELGNAVALGEMAAAGETDFWNPDVQRGVLPLVSNAVKSSGRADRGLAPAGFMPGPNGGMVPMFADDRGNLVPATRNGTSAKDDPVAEIRPDQVGQVIEGQKAFNQDINRFVSPQVKQDFVNRSREAKASKQGKQRVVSYSNGEVRTGGSRSWRNNNPGNIEYGAFAKRQGAIGSDGRFAIFPDDAAGTRAQVNLLKGDAYRNLSVTEAINRYAPPSENDTNRYIGTVARMAGVKPSTKISQMTDGQFYKLTQAMRKHEGYKPGQVGKGKNQRLDRAGYRAVASGAIQPPGKGKKTQQWSKLDDGTLYNQYTGETKAVGSNKGSGTAGSSGLKGKNRFMSVDGKVFDMDQQVFIDPQSAGNNGQATLTTLLGEDYDPASTDWKVSLVEKLLKGVPAGEQLAAFEQILNTSSPNEALQQLKPIQAQHGAVKLVEQLGVGISPERMKTPAGQLLAQVQAKLGDSGVQEADLLDEVARVFETTGISPARFPEAMALLGKRLDQLAAERKRDAERSARYERNRSTGTDYGVE